MRSVAGKYGEPGTKEYFRRRNAQPNQRKHRRVYNRGNPHIGRKIAETHRKKHPDHVAARTQAQATKKPGQKCAECDKPATAAHHTSYGDNPKHVWLCKEHHDAKHRTRPNVRATLARKALGAPGAGDAPGAGGARSRFVLRERAALEALLEKARRPEDPKTPAEPHERIRGSDKNKPGSAASSGGSVSLDADTVASLAAKVKAHNEKSEHKVTLGMLKAVWRRGAGAFSATHRPSQSRSSWAMARVNAFLRIVRTGRPKNPNYVQDNDLLPASHKRSSS